MQDRICYIGQSHVYEESRDTLQELLGVDVSEKQIERVCHCYGKLLDKEAGSKKPDTVMRVKKDEWVYAMADGSMVLTREEGWKEMKLGRLFTNDAHIDLSENRPRITESVYTAHLGHYKDFLLKWEREIPAGSKLVLLADGAKWFWDWGSEKHPDALQILDYYHCKEYLCEFAAGYFGDKEKCKAWIEKQEKYLFRDKVSRVIKNIEKLSARKAADSAIKRKILTYFKNNQQRMYYGTYRQKGLLVGSGPIEAAHRNVIQQRLKLAGQRWTKLGAQFIANLRVCRKSQRWDNIVELTKGEKIAA